MSVRYFIVCLLGITTIFILDVIVHWHSLATLGYIIIILFILRYPYQKKQALTLSIVATAFIGIDYLLTLKTGFHLPMDRLLSVLTIWLTMFFSIRYKSLLDKDAKHKNQLHTIFNNATEAILIVNATGTIVMANSFTEKLFGFNEGELTGNAVDILVPDSFRPSHHFHREAFMASPKNRPLGNGLELVAKHKDGHEFPVEISLSHFKNTSGQFAIAFIIDLTEKKKAEQNLNTEQKLAKTYFELAPVLFVALDQSGKVISINEYGCNLLGYSKTYIIGKNWFTNFLSLSVRDEMQAHFESLQSSSPQESVFENPVLTSQGKEIEISWKNTIFKDNQNRTIVLAAGTDITARKKHEKLMIAHHQAIQNLNDQLEQKIRNRTIELNDTIHQQKITNAELKKNQKLLNTIIHHFPDGIIGVLDKDMRYIFADGQELRKLGLDKPNNKGERIFDNVYPTLSTEAEEKLKSVFKGNPVTYDVEMDKQAYTVNSVPIQDGGNEVSEIMVVIKNITKRKQVEKELLKSIEKEKELAQMKTQFVTMASHEFRTPLTTILSSAFLLENYSGEELENKKSTYINRIKNSVNNLTQLLNDFILLGKLEEGKVKVSYSPINIRQFLEELVPEIELVRKEDQRVRCEYSGERGEIMLDKQLLRGILLNLIGNAIKYSPADSLINIDVVITSHTLTIKVTDRGIGIPLEAQPHIFKRFYRAENATNINGTGLGLNIARKHAKLMKGKIEFKSDLNEGTTFTVTLPLDKGKISQPNLLP
jgi:PAS domain S-box-containing protein